MRAGRLEETLVGVRPARGYLPAGTTGECAVRAAPGASEPTV